MHFLSYSKPNPTNYTIKTIGYCKDIKGSRHPKSWILDGSNNNIIWEIIDEQKNCNFTKENGVVHIFKINENKSKNFRFIRFEQTDVNWKEKIFLQLNPLKFMESWITKN